MKRAIAFYRDVLDLEIIEESEYWSEVKVSESETYLGLHSTSEEVNKIGTTEVTFRVIDIEASENWLKSKGVTITREKIEIAPGRWVVNFVDPDNNPMSIFSMVS